MAANFDCDRHDSYQGLFEKTVHYRSSGGNWKVAHSRDPQDRLVKRDWRGYRLSSLFEAFRQRCRVIFDDENRNHCRSIEKH